jgi:acyl-CoA hydrolase
VNYVGRTSLEVGVKVLSEDPLTGKQTHTSSAYLTFVAVDGHGKPAAVPPLQPETDDEHRRFKDAKERQQNRLNRRKNS